MSIVTLLICSLEVVVNLRRTAESAMMTEMTRFIPRPGFSDGTRRNLNVRLEGGFFG
jgi:hypothetical protein